MVKKVKHEINTWKSPPRHCKDLLVSGDNVSGVRQIHHFPNRPYFRVNAYCEQTIDGEGWTVVQRRSNDSNRERFYRTFKEYQLGFADTGGEFWLGLDPIHALTPTGLHELRIDLEDYDGEQGFAKYGYLRVEGPPFYYLGAKLSYGAWWYHNCYDSNLNGHQYNFASTAVDEIRWNAWDGHDSLRRTSMMVHPAY
ncbi:ficolin-1-like [Scylla paramamosain]|uniref:ficolin-1-like n=1 Tax=Scylla paramamosain TaxID=85552 RepID=UPI0030838B2E